MKRIYILIVGISILSISCKKNIDLYPLNNVAVDNFYKNAAEVQTALSGCYAGLRNTLIEEWQMTELRSDNSIMGNAASGSVPNREKSDIDLFIPATSLTAIYTYWSANYTNIRNINLVLNSLALDYDSTSGKLVKSTSTVSITDAEFKELSAQAAFYALTIILILLDCLAVFF